MNSFDQYYIDVPAHAQGNVKVKCPQCSGTRRKRADPCLSVNIPLEVWYCHHCGWKGGLKKKQEGLHREKTIKPILLPADNSDTEIEQYFNTRKISKSTYSSLGIYQAGGWIAFPCYDKNELITCKYRGIKKKAFKLTKGAQLTWWNKNAIYHHKTIIITEGEMDALSLIECGVNNVISLPNGSNINFLKTDTDIREHCDKFILAVDNDEAGEKVKQEMMLHFGRLNCLTIDYPADCKDLNDVLMKHGTEAARGIVIDAEPLPIVGISKAPAISSKLKESWFNKGIKLLSGFSTGFKGLDSFFTIQLGKVTVITGTAGTGKSTFAENLVVNLARKHQLATAIFSPENTPIDYLIAKFIYRLGEQPLEHPYLHSNLDEMIEFAGKYFTWITLQEDWSLEALLDYYSFCIKNYNSKVLLLDPWNNIEMRVPHGITSTDYIGTQLRKVKQFAINNQVHVFIVAHPRKINKKEVPQMEDIHGSVHWGNSPDTVISLWRDRDSHSQFVDVHIQKVRNATIGKEGKCQLWFDPEREVFK